MNFKGPQRKRATSVPSHEPLQCFCPSLSMEKWNFTRKFGANEPNLALTIVGAIWNNTFFATASNLNQAKGGKKLVSFQTALYLLSQQIITWKQLKSLWRSSFVSFDSETESHKRRPLCVGVINSHRMSLGLMGPSQKVTASELNHLQSLSYLKRENILRLVVPVGGVTHPAEPVHVWTNDIALACQVLTDWSVFWIQTMPVLLFYFPLQNVASVMNRLRPKHDAF